MVRKGKFRRGFSVPRDQQIPRGTRPFKNTVQVIGDRIPPSIQQVILVLVIQFEKINKGKIIQKQITIASGSKHFKEDDDALFDGAFKNNLAQLTFSYDKFWVLDSAFMWFEPKEQQETITSERFIQHSDEKGEM